MSSITSAISPKMKLQAILLVSVITIAVLGYFSYKKNWFGVKDKVDMKLHTGAYSIPATPPVTPVSGGMLLPGMPGFTGTTDYGGIITPPAGTGAVPLSSANLQGPIIKPDETITADFQKELYKQTFLPYDQYPYLYDDNYRQALTTTPGASDIGTNPYNQIYGYRPPIQGGDIPPGANNFDQMYDTIYKNYGLYPPGGDSQTYLDDQYFYPYTGFGQPTSLDPGLVPGTNIPTSGSSTTDQMILTLIQQHGWNPHGITQAQFQQLLDAINALNTTTVITNPPPDPVPTTNCDAALCKSKFYGSCTTECIRSGQPNSAKCLDCKATCCNWTGSMAYVKHTTQARVARYNAKRYAREAVISDDDRKEAWKAMQKRAADIRLMQKADAVVIPKRTQSAQSAKRSMYTAGIAIA